MVERVVIFGSSGAIGRAFIQQVERRYPDAQIYGFSRSVPANSAGNVCYQSLDDYDEATLAKAAIEINKQGLVDQVMVANGILHEAGLYPEKSLKQLSADNFQRLFFVNTIVPALIAKHFIPLLKRDSRSVFAALSARVGSISDNRLGGWYAYRASKTALNMIIKTAAIETARRNKRAIIVGLHPGTVDSDLSKPFQANVPANKLFTPDKAVAKLLQVLEQLSTEDSGKCFAWDGSEVLP